MLNKEGNLGINLINNFRKLNMNKKLEQIVQKAINQIQSLSLDKIQIIKSEFYGIYSGAISAEESWSNLTGKKLDKDLEEAFLDLGNLISIPRTGALNILRDAYKEDSSDDILNFLKYQSEVKEEVYKLIIEVVGK